MNVYAIKPIEPCRWPLDKRQRKPLEKKQPIQQVNIGQRGKVVNLLA